IFQVQCGFEFANINCTSLDKTFMDVDECFLKSVNRTYKYLTIRSKIYQLPVDDIKVRILCFCNLLNGYKPFLFNFTLDACKFLTGQKNNRIQFFYELFAPYSNMLHACPYNHDIHVDKLPINYLNHKLSNVLPVPDGYYCVHSTYSTHNKPVFDLKVYVIIS
ncbi:hypothetical protein KR054_008225, partial [Drosophila jambulina]